MGYSPETVVISTALLHPKKLVVIYSRDVDGYFDLAAELLTDQKIIRHSGLKHESINLTDPIDLYRKLRWHVTAGVAGKMDVTGGKKVMSASSYRNVQYSFNLVSINNSGRPRRPNYWKMMNC